MAFLPTFRLGETYPGGYSATWQNTIAEMKVLAAPLTNEALLPPDAAVRDAILHNVRDRWDRYEEGRRRVESGGFKIPGDLAVVAALHLDNLGFGSDGHIDAGYLDELGVDREVLAWSTLGRSSMIHEPFDDYIQKAVSKIYRGHDIDIGPGDDSGELKIARMVSGVDNWAVLSLRTRILRVNNRRRGFGSQVVRRAVGLLNMEHPTISGTEIEDSVRQLARYGDGPIRMTEGQALPHKKRVAGYLEENSEVPFPVISSVYQTHEKI